MILLRILFIKLFILKSHALYDKLALDQKRNNDNNMENYIYSAENKHDFNEIKSENASDVHSESSKQLGNQILH